jgi:hypothetical protein
MRAATEKKRSGPPAPKPKPDLVDVGGQLFRTGILARTVYRARSCPRAWGEVDVCFDKGETVFAWRLSRRNQGLSPRILSKFECPSRG